MGYELHITRADDWFKNSDNQITADEWLELLGKDPELKQAGIEQYGPYFVVFAHVSDPAKSSWLSWFDGNIESKFPTSRMIKKMISLSKQLGAKVQGDDGEVYTLEEMHGVDEAYDKSLGYE
jgi:hypothetical protein